MSTVKCSAIKRLARLGRDPCALLIVVLAGLGAAHILVRTASYGAGISPDSSYLLSTALNFLAGEGWRDFAGRPQTGWPPLFPLLLAALGWVGIDPLEAGRLVNAAAFGLTLLATGLYLRSNLRSQWLVLAATVVLLASLPLSYFAGRFLTDPLFALLTLLALIQLAAFLHRGGRTPLLLSAIFTALAAITRYPGAALIGTDVLMLLPLARLKHTLVFGAISSVPLLTVLAHNWAVSGTLTGRGGGSGQSLADSLSQVVDVFWEWVIPPNTPDGFAYQGVGLIGLVGAVVVLRPRMRSNVRLEPALPFGVFAAIYLVFMIAVVPLTVGQPIDSRYLLPIYVPLLLIAALLLDRFLSIKAAGRKVAAKWCLVSPVLLAALAHIGYSAHRNLTITDKARVAGFEAGSYNAAHWQHSETLNYLQDTPLDGKMYSNVPTLVWFWNRTAVIGKHEILPYGFRSLTSTILRGAGGADAYILWIRNETQRRYAYNDFDIRLLPGVDTVAELPDGGVFRVTATEPFDPDRHRARKQRYVNQLIRQASEHVARAGWTVYRTGRTLTYRKQPCSSADVQATFVLHVVPADPADLPADRQQYSSDNLDFRSDRGSRRQSLGFRLGDQCIAIAQLPDYPIDRIYTGQWISEEDRTLWEAEFSASR